MIAIPVYYIYHVPSKCKIGCSVDPDARIKQKYGELLPYEVIEIHIDINIASSRELKLQKMYEYKVDYVSYVKTKESHRLRAIAGGKAGGIAKKRLVDLDLHRRLIEASVVNGKNVGSNYGSMGAIISNNKEHTCPTCGKVGKANVMQRWHFNRCRSKV